MKSVFFVCDICKKTVKKTYLLDVKATTQIIMNGEGKITQGPELSKSFEVCNFVCAIKAFNDSFKAHWEEEQKEVDRINDSKICNSENG